MSLLTMPAEKYDDLIWRMADGTPIRVGDMTPRHALNSWRMLHRKMRKIGDALSWRMAMGPQPGGDMACDAFDMELDRLMEYPCTHADREPIMRALFLRSLDTWIAADVPEGWPQPRYEGVPVWDRYDDARNRRVKTETRWAACMAVGPHRWREVCIGELAAVWAFVREGANRGEHYKCVRVEYIDPATGVYTEDAWERREREMILRRSDDSMLGMRLNRYRTLSPAEIERQRAENDRQRREWGERVEEMDSWPS